MERKFYNEELEQLIREKADQYKVYPSERVWKNIYRTIHSPRRWYWLSFIVFFAAVGYFGITELGGPSVRRAVTQNQVQPPASSIDKPILGVPFTTMPESNQVVPGGGFNEIHQAPQPTALTANRSRIQPVAIQESGLNLMPSTPGQQWKRSAVDFSVSSPVSDLPAHQLIAFTEPQNDAKIDPVSKEENKRINWLQEYAVYELIVPKLKRLSWQLSFSPTMNYRKLMGNKNARIPSDVKNVPIAMNIEGDLDRLVNHKPALGFELGTHLLYAVSKNLILKGGVQFNYSRYEIQAYTSPSSELATIALNNTSGGVDGDSITTYTSLRNFGGSEIKDLNNQYFQISAPIGVEFVVVGNKKIQFAVASTIQPTYLLNRNTYLITTDYKNYASEPSLVRRWNLNTSAEAFIAYKAVGVKWQIGPQFRYQILSTYNNRYPIKENLMEYGIKVGVSKTIR